MPLSQRPEFASLRGTRTWVILAMTTLSWLLTSVLTASRWSQLSGAEHLCLIASGALIISAIVLVRFRWALWLPMVAMLVLGATALVPAGTFVWTYPQTYLGYVGFILSMLLPRRAGLVTSILIPIGVWVIWIVHPQNIVPEAFTVGNGFVLVVRMLGAQLLLWWTWWWLNDLAIRVDDQWRDMQQALLADVVLQERSQAWRTAAQRIHATSLNSISALLASRAFDPSLLRGLAQEAREAIEVPATDSVIVRRTAPVLPVNAAIVLITAALGGALVGGSFYAVFVPMPHLWGQGVLIALTFVGCATAMVVVVRKRRIRALYATGLAAIPALVPWVMASQSFDCGDIGAVSAAASIAGFAVVCITLWSSPVPFIVDVALWTVGAILVTRAAPVECVLAPTVIVLNVATFLPLIAVVLIVGTRTHRRSLGRIADADVSAEVSHARAHARAEIDREMGASVAEAADVFDALADAQTVDRIDEVTLRCLAARMRAAVQVDLARAVGFDRGAYDLVTALARDQVVVDVGVLSASDDPRPLPAQVAQALARIARAARGNPVRLQCLSAPGMDFLSMTVPAAAVHAVGLAAGDEREIADCLVGVQEAEGGETPTVVVTVERVPMAAESSVR